MPSIVALALAGAVSTAAVADNPCADGNTQEMTACLAEHLAKHEGELARYVSAARDRLEREAAEAPTHQGGARTALRAFDAAEAAWSKYRDAECGAVHAYWSDGTIPNLKALTCRITLTRAHTHTVWSEWLTYPDSTAPILPEPPTATNSVR